MPISAFQDKRGIRRPKVEKLSLNSELFPQPLLEDQKAVAKSLIAHGFVLEGFERLMEIDSSSMDSMDYLQQIAQYKEEYPINCAIALSKWFETAVQQKFVALLPFCDFLGHKGTAEIDHLQRNIFDKLSEALIEHYGVNYLETAEKLRAFAQGLKNNLPNWEDIIKQHKNEIFVRADSILSIAFYSYSLGLSLNFKGQDIKITDLKLTFGSNLNNFLRVFMNENLKQEIRERFISQLLKDEKKKQNYTDRVISLDIGFSSQILDHLKNNANPKDILEFSDLLDIKPAEILKYIDWCDLIEPLYSFSQALKLLKVFNERGLSEQVKQKFLTELKQTEKANKIKTVIDFQQNENFIQDMNDFFSLLGIEDYKKVLGTRSVSRGRKTKSQE